MTPEESVKKLTAYLENLEKAKKLSVAVGLPKEKVGGKAYPSGLTVIEVGTMHEFGTKDIPRRSFLRVPFALKRKDLADAILEQFKDVLNGQDAETALGLIGVQAQSISQGAFTSNGYGQWESLKASTIKNKGSSQTLIDTGLLRSSITYIVR